MIVRQEWRSYTKTLLIWTICVAGLDFFMILMYPSLQETMKELASAYQSMGSLGTAFGIDRLDLAEPMGFYGTYVGMILALGGAMFAAILGTGVLSKEEGGHTAEYLFTLPYSRVNIVAKKMIAILSILVVFEGINILLGILGLQIIDVSYSMKDLLFVHLGQIVMHIEIAAIGIFISACTKKVNIGAGLGIALLMYFLDMMSRVLEQIENCKYITPYYYANAADILTTGKIDVGLMTIGIIITILCLVSSVVVYNSRDLAA